MILSEEIRNLKLDAGVFLAKLGFLEKELHERGLDPSTSTDEMLALIREEALKQGVPQKALAEVTGCTPAAVSRYLSGKRKPSVEFLIQALGAVGYKVQVIPVVDLPFTPEKGDD